VIAIGSKGGQPAGPQRERRNEPSTLDPGVKLIGRSGGGARGFFHVLHGQVGTEEREDMSHTPGRS
jgi:hypothetical protein